MRKMCYSLWISIIILSLQMGCSRIEKVKVLEANQVSLPYESLGTLEVQSKAYVMKPRNVWWGTLETVSLGKADTPSVMEQYKADLDKKLIAKARDRYHADALINAQYWPESSDTKAFPQGRVNARAEMIRYKPFEPLPSSEKV